MQIKPLPIKYVVLAFLVLCLASLACAANLVTPGDYMDQYGGDVNIYVKILEMTSCAELKQEFEQADANLKLYERGTPEYRASLGYRAAADNRMKEVECDGDL